MSRSQQTLARLMAAIGIVLVFRFAFSDTSEPFAGYIDTRAAALVFLMPILILILFHRERVGWGDGWRRLRETGRFDTQQLRDRLLESTDSVLGNYGASALLKLGENTPDRFVRYASEIQSSRFRAEEMSGLLAQKIEAEDLYWQSLGNVFGFLAKMAPYFGMLATVIGMVKLLQNLHDFTKISGGMALAMQGTLYGLISFTMVYSPLQKAANNMRDLVNRRNEMIARWFLLVAQKAEAVLIREELRSQRFSTEVPKVEGSLAANPLFVGGGK